MIILNFSSVVYFVGVLGIGIWVSNMLCTIKFHVESMDMCDLAVVLLFSKIEMIHAGTYRKLYSLYITNLLFVLPSAQLYAKLISYRSLA